MLAESVICNIKYTNKMIYNNKSKKALLSVSMKLMDLLPEKNYMQDYDKICIRIIVRLSVSKMSCAKKDTKFTAPLYSVYCMLKNMM